MADAPPPVGRGRLAAAVLGSLALHAAVAAATSAWTFRPAPTLPEAVTVSLVAVDDEPAPSQDSPVAAAAPAPDAAATPRPVKPARPRHKSPPPRPAAAIPTPAPFQAPQPPQSRDADGGDPPRERTTPAPVGGGATSPAGYRLGQADTPAPSYPWNARRKGHQGTVVVRLAVASDGRALAATVAASSGDNSLDRAAVDTLLHWRLIPARRDGRPVAAEVEVPIRFVLE